ncbi:MAG: hypothetical protein ABIG89_01135 [Candidatus Woesearchaeota archaeon]
MARIKQAVFDTGPFIHLSEIKSLSLTILFIEILITDVIFCECRRINDQINKLKNVPIYSLIPKIKDFSKYLIEKYDLDLGEATGIALCKQENVLFFFTDDLLARESASSFGFKAHGTLAIITRAYREEIINKKKAKELLIQLYEHSSLFLTKDLLNWCLKEIDDYQKKGM